MRKYSMVTYWLLRVGDRVFQRTEKPERRDELLELLPRLFPGAEIKAEQHRERRYI